MKLKWQKIAEFLIKYAPVFVETITTIKQQKDKDKKND